MTTPFDKHNSAPECVSAVAALLLDGHKRVTVQNLYNAINELRCSKKQYTNIKGFKEMLKHAIHFDKMRQWPHVNCACFKMDTGRAYEAYVCHEKSVASKQKQTADQVVSTHWIVTQARAKHDFETMSDHRKTYRLQQRWSLTMSLTMSLWMMKMSKLKMKMKKNPSRGITVISMPKKAAKSRVLCGTESRTSSSRTKPHRTAAASTATQATSLTRSGLISSRRSTPDSVRVSPRTGMHTP